MATASITDQAREQADALDAAHDRLKDEHDPDGQLFDAPSQLSFNLGAGRRDSPEHASLKLAGQLPVRRDFLRREGFTVQIIDQFGEVILERSATITGITFKDSTDQYGVTTTERQHTASWD